MGKKLKSIPILPKLKRLKIKFECVEPADISEIDNFISKIQNKCPELKYVDWFHIHDDATFQHFNEKYKSNCLEAWCAHGFSSIKFGNVALGEAYNFSQENVSSIEYIAINVGP